MAKLIIMKDPHFRSIEPFYSAQKLFCEWIEKQEWNNDDNYFLDLGDTFDQASPDSKSNQLGIDFFENRLKFKEKFVLIGNTNHEYNAIKSVHAVDILLPLNKNIEIIYEPTIKQIDNLKFLLLPFINNKKYIPDNYKSMREYYEDLPGKFKNEVYDFISYHCEDETISFSKEHKGIDLSYLKTDYRISGHIHLHQLNYALGMTILQRYDEKNQPNELLMIDTLTKEKEYIKVPKFLDYVDIEYGTDIDLDQCEAQYQIFTVKNCISKKTAEDYYQEKYKDNDRIYFRKFEVKDLEVNNNKDILNVIDNDKSSLTIKNLLQKFYDENNVNEQVRKKINEKF